MSLINDEDEKGFVIGLIAIVLAVVAILIFIDMQDKPEESVQVRSQFRCMEDEALYPAGDYPYGKVVCVNIEELFHNSPLLHLRGQDVTEEDLKWAYRMDYNADEAGFVAMCKSLKRGDPIATLQVMGTFRDATERFEEGGTKQPRIMNGAIARPGQIGLFEDKVRMAELLLEECSALTGLEGVYRVLPPACCKGEQQ